MKKDTVFPPEENESRERLIRAVLNALTSPDAEEAGEVMRSLVRDNATGETDEYFTLALPLSRCAARAYAPLVWRALLDEVKHTTKSAAFAESFSEVRRHKWEIMYSQKSTVST